jgi:hypothetical protein
VRHGVFALNVVKQVGVFGPVAGQERVVKNSFLIVPAWVGSPAEDSIDCPSTMNAAACSWVSFATAGMMLPRVMRNRLSIRRALMLFAACMKSRRSTTARPLVVRDMS